MKLNCKAGDLAVIVLGPCAGTIVNVLRLVPPGVVFRTKTGRPHAACKPATWEIKSAGGKLTIKRVDIDGRRVPSGRSIYGCIQDRGLRPIRDPGDDARDETLDWLPVPSKTREHA